MQQGSVYLLDGTWYLKYRIREDGRQVHKTEHLCSENGQQHHLLCTEQGEHRHRKHASKKTRSGKSSIVPPKNLAAVRLKVMDTVNQNGHDTGRVRHDLPITDFWERYLLHYTTPIAANGNKPRMKASTIRGYKQIWNQHLKSHFDTLTLRAYTPKLGTRFLRTLSSSQCKSTLKHIKALGCSIFKLAVEEELLEVNPWHDVLMPSDAIESNPTKHYTLEEAENIVTALKEYPDAQLIMALSCFLGLRPAEIVGLQWNDFGSEFLHIRRGVVRGVLDTPKTKESVADIPLVDQRVFIPLELWRKDPKRTPSKWVFPSDTGDHLHDLGNIIARKIRPALVKAKLEWKGVYSGRRGACTAAVEATGGNYAVAQQLLRHKSMKTTLDVYKKAITPEAFKAGMRQLAAANGKEGV